MGRDLRDPSKWLWGAEFDGAEASSAASVDIFERWNLPRTDVDAIHLAQRVDAAVGSWARTERQAFLEAAEAIADAEDIKRQRRSKVEQNRVRRINIAAAAALRLARDLTRGHRLPWPEEARPVQDLVTKLFVYAVTCMMQSGYATDLASSENRIRLRVLTLLRRKGIDYELLAELAWLIRGKPSEKPSDERTIRRYFKPENPPGWNHIGKDIWKRHFPLFGHVRPSSLRTWTSICSIVFFRFVAAARSPNKPFP